MKILITGGSGFIGSHLTKAMQKYSVTIFDLPESITDTKLITKVIKNKFDIIYHLAGISGTVSLDPHHSFAINVQGAINVLEAVRLYSRKTRIVFSNSRQEYGKPQYLPVNEQHPTNPTNHYGVHKLSITMYAQLYAQLCSLDTVVLRASNIFGFDMVRLSKKVRSSNKSLPGYNIINYWLSQGLEKKNIVLFGDGSQLRDCLYVGDYINALIKAGTHHKAKGEIFNIGFGQGMSMLQMANTIAKKYSVKVIKKPWPREWRTSETGSYVSDISKARRLLSWQPTTSFFLAVKNL